MNSPSKLFLSSLVAKNNLIFLVITLLLASISLLGLWQMVDGTYQQFLPSLDSKTLAIITAASIVLTLLAAIRLCYTPIKILKVSLDNMELQNRHNQDAILRLLDEMGDLADGDLTTSATVNDDITGAIADSVNYTIDALRNLVEQINSTTVQVASAAEETQSTALHLTDASDHQSQQITDVSSAITDMAASIELVSENATQSADVAQQSVTLAIQGNTAVKKAINGMDTIREQIQETSKRIKRLGESSQQIGEIVELINDIAEQTNILSLNAAIQATMAGEAGRGFAVVADEVQRLAERSSNATKQIDALVKTIQSDTSEAVSSMERSTSEVVSGAKLSQDAGTSLAQIETVSRQLAELINNISDNAKQQAIAAVSTSDSMNVIQEITMQTSTGTNESAASIGRLLELTNELRKSVSGFTLPN
jgi:twitching motility protein PilJ